MFKINNNVTIIIVTFNSQHIISDCIKNIYKKYPIIIVDNNSSDKTVNVIKNNFPEVNLVKSKNNIGYGRGNNLALEQVDTPYSLILNPDISDITPVKIKNLIAVANNYRDAAFVTPYLLSPNDANKTNPEITYYNKILEDIEPHIKAVNWSVGCALLVNMKIMKDVGFFDKNIFMFGEENDLCDRIIKSGYKILQANKITLIHSPGTSSIKSWKITYLRSWHMGWSKLYIRRKNKGLSKAICSIPRYLLSYIRQIIFALVTLNFNNILINYAKIIGVLQFTLGMNAFDKNDQPRGVFKLKVSQT